MSNYTAAPWILKDNYPGKDIRTQRSIELKSSDRNIWIASIHGTHVAEKDDNINIANAQLIAAAPELLEALKQMVVLYEEIQPTGGYQGYYEEAIAAIAKAEGKNA